MQVGSLVECVKSFDGSLYAFMVMLHYNITPPILGQSYVVDGIEDCSCGNHKNLVLDYCSIPWHIEHFKELQQPMNVNEIIENALKESEEKVFA